MGTRQYRTTSLVAGFVGLAGLLATAGCQSDASLLAEEAMQGGDARYHAETGELYRLYRYYPEEEVYRSVYHYTWYWQNEDGGWRTSDKLPEDMTVSADFFELVELPGPRPYVFHYDVKTANPSYETLVAQTDAFDRIESEFTTGQGEVLVNVDTSEEN